MKRWLASDDALLRQHYASMPSAELAKLLGCTPIAAKSRAKKIGVSRGVRHEWLADEIATVKKLYPHRSTREIAKLVNHTLSSIYKRAELLGLHKTKEYMDSPAACRLRRGDNVGAKTRFKKGQVPPNKGLRRPGWFRGRMRDTWFRKGDIPASRCAIGTIRTDCEGYLHIKVGNGLGGHGNTKVWMFLHRKVWEDAHGPVPPGFRIWWKDRNHANCALDNLEMISDADHMARTTIHNLPPELKEVIQIKGRIKRLIRKREKENGKEQDARSAQPSL